jgi:hypothetical protein
MPESSEALAGVLARLGPEMLGQVLKETGESAAWVAYHQWVREVRTAARLELESCSKWDEYLEMRGVMKCLAHLLGFRDDVKVHMQEIEEEKENR